MILLMMGKFVHIFLPRSLIRIGLCDQGPGVVFDSSRFYLDVCVLSGVCLYQAHSVDRTRVLRGVGSIYGIVEREGFL